MLNAVLLVVITVGMFVLGLAVESEYDVIGRWERKLDR